MEKPWGNLLRTVCNRTALCALVSGPGAAVEGVKRHVSLAQRASFRFTDDLGSLKSKNARLV